MSICLYICTESATTISALGISLHRREATADFPTAVGPANTISFGFWVGSLSDMENIADAGVDAHEEEEEEEEEADLAAAVLNADEELIE